MRGGRRIGLPAKEVVSRAVPSTPGAVAAGPAPPKRSVDGQDRPQIRGRSGQRFDRLLQTRVFPTAKMRVVRPYQYFLIRQNEASGYLWWAKEIAGYIPVRPEQGAEVNHVVNAMPWNLQQAAGAGFLVGDADDLQNWDDALLAGSSCTGNGGRCTLRRVRSATVRPHTRDRRI